MRDLKPGALALHDFLFNFRIAKTGSTSFIALFFKLGAKLGYDVDTGHRQHENVQDDSEGMFNEVDSILRTHKPMVKIRHYVFLDFAQLGYQWNPDWFNLVRDPIEKVYYWKVKYQA